jgi:cytochrome c biogenesis protein CcmG/thiol:disulfide interchange protein DsbE
MRRLGPIITAVFAAALVALLAFGLTTQGASRALDEALAAGRQPPAPNVTRPLPVLNDARGPTAQLTQWRGGVIVVNFWASWCPPCAAEAPLLERAQRTLTADHAGTIVGITYKDITANALSSIKSFGLSYPNLRDINGSYAAGYGTDKIPETFVLNRQLHVVAISRGEITEQSWLTRAIAEAERT